MSCPTPPRSCRHRAACGCVRQLGHYGQDANNDLLRIQCRAGCEHGPCSCVSVDPGASSGSPGCPRAGRDLYAMSSRPEVSPCRVVGLGSAPQAFLTCEIVSPPASLARQSSTALVGRRVSHGTGHACRLGPLGRYLTISSGFCIRNVVALLLLGPRPHAGTPSRIWRAPFGRARSALRAPTVVYVLFSRGEKLRHTLEI